MKRFAGFLVPLSLFLIQCGSGEKASEGTANAQVATTEEQGSDLVPTTKNDALTSTAATGIVSVDAGFAGNGSKITIPTGFTAAQCKFTAAVANVDGSALSTSVAVNTTTGEVVCKKVVQEREEVPATTKSCVASYTVVCVK